MNWSEGIHAFKSYLLLERGLSENTVVNYVYDVQKLVAYFETNNIAIGPTKVSPSDLLQFIYEAAKKVKQMFRKPFPSIPIVITEWQTAEMIKYFTNCFLATKVTFANQMYDITTIEQCNKILSKVRNVWGAKRGLCYIGDIHYRLEESNVPRIPIPFYVRKM